MHMLISEMTIKININVEKNGGFTIVGIEELVILCIP